MKKNIINLRMIELYRLGIVLLMLSFLAGKASAQPFITITESSGTPNDGIITCGTAVTLSVSPGDLYLWNTGATTQDITTSLGGIYTVTVTDGSGGTATASAIISVIDDITPPVSHCDTITVHLDSEGEALVTLDDVDDGSYDSCSLVTLNVPDWFAAGTTCADAVCISDGMYLRSPRNSQSGTYYSSCFNYPFAAESWMYFNVTGAGTVDFVVRLDSLPITSYDITVWGPFATPDCSDLFEYNERYCKASVSGDVPLSFNASATGYYMLVIAKYEDLATTISFSANAGDAVIERCTSDNSTASYTFDCNETVGSKTVTLQVTDISGNSSSCSAVIQVLDTLSPIIMTCPSNRIFPDCNFSVPDMKTDIVADDNCDYSPAQYPPPGFTSGDFHGDTVIVLFTVTDDSGNSSTCTSVITVNDTTPPSLYCRVDTLLLPLTPGGTASLDYSQILFSISDDCTADTADIAFELSEDAFNCADRGLHTITLTASDLAGNDASCQAIVNIQDVTPPAPFCRNVTVYLDASGMATATGALINNNSVDNCNGVLMLSPGSSSYDCTQIGPNTFELTVTDESGNSATCNATVTVDDTILPSAHCKNTAVLLDGNGVASITASAVDNGSADNCSGSILLSVSPVTFSCSNIGLNTVTLTVTDAGDNNSSCTAIVNVEDDEDPQAVCQDFIAHLDESGVAHVTGLQLGGSSTDNCQLLVFSPEDIEYNCADLGIHTIQLIVIDASYNTASCSSVVTVEDVLAPAVLCRDVTAYLDAAGTVTVTSAQTDNGTTDNCTDAADLDFAPQSFSYTCTDPGPHTISMSVTDEHDNTATCTAVITVVDTTQPIARCRNRIIFLGAGGTVTVAISQLDNGSSDNCQSTLVLSPASFSYNCSDLGDNFETLTATDAQGNTAVCTATITIQDNFAPVANCQNLTVSLGSSGTVTVTGAELNSNSSDNCQGVLSFSPASVTYHCSDIGVQAVTLTVTDGNGNTSSCTSTVTVQDITAPTAVCKNITLPLNAQGQASGVPAGLNNGSSDNCTVAGSLAFAASEVLSYTCAQVGTRTVTLTVTDLRGNSATCTAVITVSDMLAPVITVCPANITVNDCNALITDMTGTLTATDNCVNIASVTQTPPAGSGLNLLGPGSTIRFDVTDQHGNTSSCTSVVTVDDTVPPQFTSCPANITVSNQINTCNALVNITVPVATDNCGTVTVVRTGGLAENAPFPVGTTVQTYLATDLGMNTSVCSFSVIVTDVQAPIAVCKNVTVQLNAQGAGSLQPAALNSGSTDNCISSGQLTFTSTSNLTFSCANIGSSTVILTVTDAAGNSATCTSVVTVEDKLAPVARCKNLTLSLNGSSLTVPAANLDNGSSDNCTAPGNLMFSGTGLTFNCSNIGDNTVALAVTDTYGNTGTCTSVIKIEDKTAPTASCKNRTVTLDASGMVSVTGASFDNGSSDNCTAAGSLVFHRLLLHTPVSSLVRTTSP